MPLSLLLSSLTLVLSTTSSEPKSGKKHGYQTSLARAFQSLMESIHLRFLPTLLIKPFGKLKVSQPIEFLSKTLLLLFLATDIHSLLILNFKVKNGSEEEREPKWLPFNYPKSNGWRRSKWLYQTVTSLWLKLLDKRLMPFLILSSLNNSLRREETSP